MTQMEKEANEEMLSGKRIERYGGGCGNKVIYINLGYPCNQDCVFCVIKGNEGNFPVMSTSEAKKIIGAFLSGGGEMIMLTGGEPLIRKDIAELMDYAESFPSVKEINILTNGTFLTDELLDNLSATDRKGILSFSVSLHSHEPAISFELTSGDRLDFQKTKEAIRSLGRRDVRTSIYQVITRDNYRELPEFVRYVKEEFPEVRSVVLAYPFPQGAAERNDRIYERFSRTKEYVLEALKFLKENGYSIGIATCGQFPLCIIPGYETAVLKSFDFFTDNVMGTIGATVFHEFEWSAEVWIDKYKNKDRRCAACVMNDICQGFWKKYVDLFGYDGINPISSANFSGNKIITGFTTQTDLDNLLANLLQDELNLVIFEGAPDESLFEKLRFAMKSDRIYAIFSRNK